MKISTLTLALLVLLSGKISAQSFYYQYFDGADTLSSSIIVKRDTGSTNIWQIGGPHKVIFNSAATVPNVIVTDTVNFYPINNVSSFVISTRHLIPFAPFISAYRWKQKLDMDKKHDGGIVEYSIDSGATWLNAFNNTHVYNFYGFNPANKDTLLSGKYAFSGRDTTWKDIWLCFDPVYASSTDSLLLRFTFVSDSIDSSKEGWMIDNLMAHRTFVHTATTTINASDYFAVYPTNTTGAINVEAKKISQVNLIDKMLLFNTEGKLVKEYNVGSTNTMINIHSYADGMYYLKVITKAKTSTFPIVLKK
jgi:Secretion system C-terminal sorting domain